MSSEMSKRAPGTFASQRNESVDVTVTAQRGRGPRVSNQALSRRTVLRGAGVALALPLFESMTLAQDGGGGTQPTRRLLYVYVPNGVKVDEWRQGDGKPLKPGEHALQPLPELLAPLKDFADRTLMLRGLTQDKARANGDGAGDHARASAVYLTGVQPLKTEGRVRVGVSADQVAAQTIGAKTRLRSLVLGLEPGRQSGQCDSGYACAYSGHVSWESATVPAAKETAPRRAFDRLFRGGDAGISAEARTARLGRRRSLLDYVREESRSLATRLGSADRARLDEYETGLRELERRLGFEGSDHVAAVPDEARPSESQSTFAEEASVMGEIVSYAFQADVTRVATLMYGNEGSGRRYTEVGVKDGHHSLSHHGGDAEKLASIGKINRLHMASLAETVRHMAGAKALDGSLLDSTAIVFGSGIAEGNRHDHHDLPVFVVAGKSFGVRGGRTLAYPKNTPLNNLHGTLLEALGAGRVAGLGDATGFLDSLG